MRQCIYCRESKPDEDFTLEHVIPQFMGGAYAIDKLKTRDVCERCNNNLGLFVDAAFEKDFLVYNNLRDSAYAFFDPSSPTSLPLRCMGVNSLQPPHMDPTEICEYWIGPLGEQVFWIRPDDARLYWYSGGNPRTVKKQKSTAYFIFSERSKKKPEISWFSFRDAFEGRRVKKIMCTKIDGADPKTIGFSEPDHVDSERIAFFMREALDGKEQKCQLRINPIYDQRFMAKLAIGIAHCLFGNSVASTTYMEELYKALWFKEGDPIPNVFGIGTFGSTDSNLTKSLGIKHGVTITVLYIEDTIAVNLNIGETLNWTVQCANAQDLAQDELGVIGHEGLSFVLFKPIGKCIELSLSDFLAHKTGDKTNAELSEVESKIQENSGFFENL